MAGRRSWEKAKSPYWSAHVAAWYRGRHEAEAYCRQRKIPTATFEQWVRHLVSPSSAQACGKSAEIAPGKAWKARRQEPAEEAQKARPPSLRRAHR